nr:lysosome-associated membrane glycoprotein 3 isoform X2 [Pelodiscus sinensis]XP_025034978.1 lysosome-associated membrane glycoprotein 3 isoform X2 [Pelodiscus sinensis]XP_025034979.1 lysosome-associated membrane glycoprotein 3 isoform X2 [Pelodiscus sinensis]|eukprot:XP_025034977.1 lysosome-associated membrane glycoprotein 3 isoform X2 [Pelodiscus sinensis]
MELKPTPQSTSFLQRTTTAQSVSPYQITSSSHAVTALFSSRTSKILTTPLHQRTSVFTATQTTNHHAVTTALDPNMTTQARVKTTQLTNQTTHVILTTTAAGKKTTAKTPLPTNETTTTTARTGKKTTIQKTEKTTLPTNHTTHSSVANTTASMKTTSKPTSPTNRTTTLAETTILTTKKTTVKTTTQPTNHTTHITAKTTGRRTNTTTVHPGTPTTTPSTTATMGPTLAPDSSPATGTYNVSSGNVTCIKASMGLKLIVQNSKMKEKGYFNINPSTTQTSGSCGNLQSNLNITFNGGFISFTFVKKVTIYYISKVEASLTVPSAGTWHNVTSKQLFTARMGHSFKCLSQQMVNLADNFQLLTVNTQLQAFAIDGNQFGKVEECSADFNIIFPAVAIFVVVIAGILALILYQVHLKRKSSAYQRI